MVSVQNNIQNMRYNYKAMLDKLEYEEKQLLEEMNNLEYKLGGWDPKPIIAPSKCLTKPLENINISQVIYLKCFVF